MNKEGFDLDFETTLENKYECPICLLILRDPMQTECGHRFCKFCIERWLSDGKSKCPIDNEDLTLGKMFPDNFAKREILTMKVRCPNRKMGCNTCVELKHIEEHTENCPYHYQDCPNNCSTTLLLRKDLEEHLQSECSKRSVFCAFCKETMLFESYGEHEIICPARMVPCDLCKEDVMREKIAEHVATTCPHATVKCCFFLLGCHKEIKREKMEKHMKSNVQKHLQLMCCAFVKLLNFQNIESILSSRTSGNTSTQNQTESMNDPTEISGELTALFQTAEGAASGVADGGVFRLARALPPARAISVTAPTAKPTLERLPSDSKSNLADGASSSELFDSEFQSLKERNTYQDESLARHSHELLELQYKYDNLERVNKDMKQKIRALEDKVNTLSDIEGRLCNGLFVWKIKNYLQRRHEAEAGEMTVIHSPPFYSNFYGYKLCMRCNLNGVDFSVGTHLSVFIHFMQGEWDDILTWPFRGKIVLSVLDQNPVADQRQHAVETLVSKPMLAAFQRPTMHRNHKGFGYMEYVPLEVLDNSTYVVNDTLILKAQVFPEV